MRIFALSDIHIDYPENRRWIGELSDVDYRNDALILAGDATHDLGRLGEAFRCLKGKFSEVFFTPGNHELWLVKSACADSLRKFHQTLDLCRQSAVRTTPVRLGQDDRAVWVVPLFSWYARLEDGEDTLFVEKPGEDPSLDAWSDTHFVKWPDLGGLTPSQYFARLNRSALAREYDAPIVSFSHFLPRRELIFSDAAENALGGGKLGDAHTSFNFSRVAGSSLIDRQVRSLGARVHVYGHQHRNRHRRIEGVTYISHCLGYSRERLTGHVRFLDGGPKQVWPETETHEAVASRQAAAV